MRWIIALFAALYPGLATLKGESWGSHGSTTHYLRSSKEAISRTRNLARTWSTTKINCWMRSGEVG